jgi:hypothetical protein
MHMELKPKRSRDTKMKNPTTSHLLRQSLAMLGAALLCIPATSGLAVSITVTNTADSGNGTLRAALASAANGDIIDLTGISGTILLTSGQLLVSNSVTILGPGPGSLAVSGYPASTNRLFYINLGLNVTVAGLTFTHGNAGLSRGGGAIYNNGSTLTVSNCTLSGNAANLGAAILNGGESGPATLTIVNSTLSGNSAGDFGGGGAIGNDGAWGGNAKLTITNCTFSGNSARFGGAIDNDGSSGGHATLIIVNSTFSANSSRGFGTVGAIHNVGSATLEIGGTILNAGASGVNIAGGTVTSLGYNLSSDKGGGWLTNTADQINTDPKLGPLQDNGGPTLTHALQLGSPAIDAGNNAAASGLSFDQRGPGFPRIVGSAVDIGAYESALTLTITCPGDISTNTANGTDLVMVSYPPPITTGSPPPVVVACTPPSGSLFPVGTTIVTCTASNGTHVPTCSFAVKVCATNITTTTSADSGPGSLRQALLNVCPNGRIDFTNTLTGQTILLTSGELLITNSLFINGPSAANLAVSGNAASRVFYVGPNLNVTIAGLTIANGTDVSGGGIQNDHSILTVSNCTLSGNAAYFGGGIHNNGESGSAVLSVSACTFSRNSASDWGGGIYNDGESFGNATLNVLNTTFSTNSAYLGGGVYNDGFYGSAALSVNACTFSGNSTLYAGLGGGIYNDDGYGMATLQIGDTILSAGASGANLQSGTINSLGYNLSSDNGGGWLTNTADQINTDPKLGPLQNNGGPTPTHALLPGSPALDKGKNLSGSSTDQRGSPRVVDLCPVNALGGDGSDIGAVEAFSVGIPDTITVLNTDDSGPGSLREAIARANICPDTNTIVFAPSAYGKITLTSGQLSITSPLAILGPGPTNLVISGNAASRVFYVAPNLNSTIAGLTIADGTNLFGGGIQNDHSILTVSNCALTGNSAVYGGAIHNDGYAGSATLSLSACTLSRNLASYYGGGIYNDGEGGNATLKVLNSTFSTNLTQFGGGVYNAGFLGSAALSVNACTFSGNSAVSGGGGGIYSDDGNGIATVQIGDTILSAGPLGANLQWGTITSLGYNLSSDNGGGFLTATADQISTDPKLGPLQNNGGPTFTHALLPGSPAIDKGKRDAISSLAVSTDQRGSPRPFDLSSIANAAGGDGSDIGAFELQVVLGTPMLLADPEKLLNGSFQFSFTNTPGASFTVLTTTNIALPLSNWTMFGTPTEISPGHFQYSDPQATNQPLRFYQVRSP